MVIKVTLTDTVAGRGSSRTKLLCLTLEMNCLRRDIMVDKGGMRFYWEREICSRAVG